MINEEEEYNNDNINTGEPSDDYAEIYSKTAIFWFTLFLSPIFGGIMLAINLKNAGIKRGIAPVLLFSVAYYILAAVAASTLLTALNLSPEQTMYAGAGLSLVTNLIGGMILTSYYFAKYFPDDDYYPRSIQGPLIVALLIFVLQSVLARYLGIAV
ncbi:hypothetical protein EOD41_15675 [Mucilaginibacter limnophilus]|uniref:Uncharacterized protein n=1 Tax=Mucilaginibacter limnophilus TaxID=1932778 RepID=A0A437MQF1_9SPHI|nr:hypothetical protein [Mucilaginibacter limnophilus]RVT99879.1 hypothetical protein EOD41_15675 [Mucilaginibacter limnophilus]